MEFSTSLFELPKNKSMQRCGPEITCPVCRKVFRAWNNHQAANGRGKYCSRECMSRAYADTFHRPESTHSQRIHANSTVNNAIALGKMERPDKCEQCGKTCRPDGHHDDYAAEKSVRWLCRSCHMKWHMQHDSHN